jgi:phosphate starvation-inducible PhoH-like protein
MRDKTNKAKLRIDDLLTFEPMTRNQVRAHEAWKNEGNHLVLSGSAGTGKTFTAFYLALESVLNKSTPWEKIHVIRSVVPTRDVGFLPGTIEEKLDPFILPYKGICAELFECGDAWDNLSRSGIVEFHSTSFIRGTTFDDAIIIVDEMQNCNFHELDSVITRVGLNTRIIFSGDYLQSDFSNTMERNGILKFLEILELMRNFSVIQFGWGDIVRSDFVREYIMTKEIVQSGMMEQE